MPQISYFFGIVIYMYYSEHNPPHIHAVYGGYKATYTIDTAKRDSGNMSKTADVLIKKWIRLRKEELNIVWEQAKKHKSPLSNVEPLD